MRKCWLTLVGWATGAAVALAACRGVEAPPSSRTPPPGDAGSLPSVHEAAPTDERLEAILATCVSTPPLVARGCAFRGDGGAGPVACVDLAPKESRDVDVLSVLVAPGAFDFARTLGIPSMQSVLDAGTPGARAMAAAYRSFEGPEIEMLDDGRPVKTEARSLMLGGVVRWATLESAGRAFSTVVVQQIPLHDAPLEAADRRAVEAWNLRDMVGCLDAHLWGRTN